MSHQVRSCSLRALALAVAAPLLLVAPGLDLGASSIPSAEARPATPPIIRDIQRLTKRIDRLTRRAQRPRTRAEHSRLRQVRRHLETAQQLLERNANSYDDDGYDGGWQEPEPDPQQREACVDWAYKNYKKSYSSASAMNEANKKCTSDVNLKIATRLYAYFSRSYSAASATNESLKGAKIRELAGKWRLLDFSLAAYARSYSAASAAQETIRQVRKTSKSSTRCVERSYKAYAQSYSAASAMNEAFKVCRRNEVRTQ